ncbi:MAG: hypothetical protein K8J31_14975, partial [Anaerolineae bacterium]|nr:hypothetical protein [Anaerolineae bacterium]
MELVLLIVGGIFALLFILNNGLQILRRQIQLRFWGTLLAFLTTIVTLVALVQSLSAPVSNPMIQTGVVSIALGVIVTGLIFLVLEIVRKPRDLVQSRGILGIGVGLLLLLSTITVPLISAFFAVPLDSTESLAVAANVDEAAIEAQQTTRAYTNLIESASATTGVNKDEVLLAVTGDTTLTDFVTSKGGDSEAVLNNALIITRAEVESLISEGDIPRLQGTLMLANLEADLRDKLNTRIASSQIETLAPIILATQTPTPTPTEPFTPTST